MSDDRKYVEAGIRRRLGMSTEQRKVLAAHNAAQLWLVQCWNCRGRVEDKLDNLDKPCPHCGVNLSKRA